MSSPDLSVVIPAYNEEERLRRAIPAIAEYLRQKGKGFEIIVVDDGSRDGTARVTEELRKAHPAVRLISLRPNRGKGAAVRAGMLDAKGRHVLFTDADQSTPIGELDKLLRKLEQEGYDLAIGSRSVRGAQLEKSQAWYRVLFGKFFGCLTRCVALRGVADTQCGFKCMTREAAQAIFPKVTSPSALFDIEMLIVASRERLHVAEVPVKWAHDPDTRIPYNLKRSFLIFAELFRICRAQKVRWPLRTRTDAPGRNPPVPDVRFPFLAGGLGIVLVSLLFFSDFFLFGKIPFDPARGSDAARHVYPLKAAVCHFLQKGELPLWNPYLLLGLPWVGDGQTYFFDPFNLPFFFLPPLEAYGVTLWLLFLSSMGAMFLLLRKLGFSQGACFLGSVVFGLNGFSVTYFIFPNATATLVWFPLVLLCLEEGTGRSRPVLFLLGGVFFGLAMLSLTPTYLAGIGATLTLYIAIRTWENRAGGILKKDSPLAGAVTALGVGLLIGAVEWLPMMQLSGASQRALSTGAGYFGKNFLPWSSLAGFVLPLTGEEIRWTGTAIPSISYLYLGIAGLVLAFAGLLTIWKNERCRLFGILGLGGLVILLSLQLIFLRRLWHVLPVFRELNVFKFLLAFYPLCAAVWVAEGYRTLSGPLPPFPSVGRLVRFLILLHGSVLVGGILFALVSPLLEPFLTQTLFPRLAERWAGHGIHPFSHDFYREKLLFFWRLFRSPRFLSAVVGLGLLRLLSLWALWPIHRARQAAATALLILLPLDLVGTWKVSLPFSAQARELYRKTNEVRLLESLLKPGERVAVFESRDWSADPQALIDVEKGKASFEEVRSAYRQDETHRRQRSLLSDILLTFQIPDIGGKQSLFLGRTLRYLDANRQAVEWRQGKNALLRHEVRFQGEPNGRLLDLLGMKYVLTRHPLKRGNFRLRMDARESERGYYLYENLDAFPRAFHALRAEVIAEGRLLQRLQDPDFNPHTAVLFEREPPSSPQDRRGLSFLSKHAEIVRYAPDRVEVNAWCSRESYLILTDHDYPGWEVFVDGKKGEIARADFLFRSVFLPAGRHRVVFRYDPLLPKIGAGISGVTLLGLCAGVCWRLAAKRRRGSLA